MNCAAKACERGCPNRHKNTAGCSLGALKSSSETSMKSLYYFCRFWHREGTSNLIRRTWDLCFISPSSACQYEELLEGNLSTHISNQRISGTERTMMPFSAFSRKSRQTRWLEGTGGILASLRMINMAVVGLALFPIPFASLKTDRLHSWN